MTGALIALTGALIIHGVLTATDATTVGARGVLLIVGVVLVVVGLTTAAAQLTGGGS